MGKYDNIHTFDDEDFLKAIRWCWDRGIYFYPVVISGQSKSFKVVPKVKIEMSTRGYKPKIGSVEYIQNDKLYDKIRELYMHKFESRNNN